MLKRILLILAIFTFGVTVGVMGVKIKENLNYKYYSLNGLFDNVGLIKKGSRIIYSGVECGKVGKTSLVEGKILLELKIDKDLSIPKKCEIEIRPIGLFSKEYIVDIQLDNNLPYLERQESYNPNDTIIGKFDHGIMGWLIGKDDVNFFQKTDSVYTILKDIRGKLNKAEVCKE